VVSERRVEHWLVEHQTKDGNPSRTALLEDEHVPA
jgi:hypothetical protein